MLLNDIGNLIIIVGVGLFLRVFFDKAKRRSAANQKPMSQRSFRGHILIGILFLFIGTIVRYIR